MNIVRPITNDGDVGYDQFGQLTCRTRQGDRVTSFFVRDVREKVCVICARGWDMNAKSFADQAVSDVLGGIVHESCLARHSGLIERAGVYGAFVRARVAFGLRNIPNGYYPERSPWGKKPWYFVRLCDHHASFVVGYRKRVWSIELKPIVAIEAEIDSKARLACYEAASDHFASENVTKHFAPTSIMLHAWGDEKMQQYIADLVKLGGYGYAQCAEEACG